MSVPFAKLKDLYGYHFSVESYQKSHSNLTIRAVAPEEPHQAFDLQFVEVHYIKMPISWRGGFELGSEQERRDITDKAGLPFQGLSSTTELYRARQGDVLILGSLMLIEETRSRWEGRLDEIILEISGFTAFSRFSDRHRSMLIDDENHYFAPGRPGTGFWAVGSLVQA